MSSAGSYGSGGGGGVGNVKFLTGNSGGPVGPDLLGNINVVGTGEITVVDNPGTNTLTIELSGSVANVYDADTGTAIPALGILNINGLGGIVTSASGHTVDVSTDGTIAINYDTDSGIAIPSADTINIVGGTGITTSGSGSTVTIALSGSGLVQSIVGDTGSPIAGALTITGSTSGASFDTTGTTITESFNYLNMPYTNAGGTQGVIKFAGAPIFGFYGGAGQFNMFLGDTAGNTSLTGTNNIGLGPIAIHAVTSGFANVGVGPLALSSCTTGNSNIAMGLDALQNLTSGAGNVAVGNQPLQNLLTGIDNVAFGISAGSNYTSSESSNILIQNAGVTSESNVIRIGTDGAGAGQQNATFIAGIYGESVGGTNAAVFIDNTGKLGTVGGSGGGVTSITGDAGGAVTGAVTLTGGTSGAIFTGSGGNTQTESFHFLAMSDTTPTTGYIKIGADIVFNCYGGVASNNTFIGQNAGASGVSGTQNVGIGSGGGGSGVMGVLTSGSLNTGCGYGAFNNLGSGFQNCSFGGDALNQLTTGHNNTALGQGALIDIVSGSNNTCIGYAAGSSYGTGTETNNVCIGANVDGTNGESNTIRLGDTASATACYVAGTYGQSVGGTNAALFIDNTGKIGTVGGSGGGGVSSIAGSSGGPLTGALTLTGGTSGGTFTGSGTTLTMSFNSLKLPDTNGAGTVGVIEINGSNVFALYGGTGNSNLYVGLNAGNATISTTGNAGIGTNTQFINTGGTDNTSVGTFTLAGLTSGNFNTAIGALSLQHVATGGSNTCIGFQSGSSYIAGESGNICVGAPGVAAENNTIHIGDGGTQTSCFIGGIAGVTVASSAAVLINTSTGQLGTVASSRRFKENIEDMGIASRDIYKLRPVKFNFKGDFNQSYGLVAEDVERVAPYLVSYDKEGLPATIKYHELPSLLLNEIQRLKLKVDELEGKLNARVR